MFTVVQFLISLAFCGVASQFACPSDASERRAVVLSEARKLLNGTFEAGSSYAGGVFLRDTNTFITVALDVQDALVVKRILLLLLTYQHANGDIGIAGVNLDPSTGHVAGTIMKADVTTDAETSYVRTIFKYVKHSGSDAILAEQVSSVNDNVSRNVSQRLQMLMSYLSSENGRFSSQHGLIWGGTSLDWGDVQNTDGMPGVQGCCQLHNDSSTVAITAYANSMYVIALRNLASLLERSDPAAAAHWQSLASSVANNIMKWLWVPHGTDSGKFLPHLYNVGPVCGDAGGSTKFECFEPRPSPFKHLANFSEDDVFVTGSTILAIEAGLLTKPQIEDALRRMRSNAIASGGHVTIGLNNWPFYPCEAFPAMCNNGQHTWYQNGGDWTWFGGRMIQNLIREGLVQDAIAELDPMLDRVCKHGFREYYAPDGTPSGSGTFHGSAGVLGEAIKMLQDHQRSGNAMWV